MAVKLLQSLINGKEYPIILQQYLEDRKDKESLSKIFVRSQKSEA